MSVITLKTSRKKATGKVKSSEYMYSLDLLKDLGKVMVEGGDGRPRGGRFVGFI